MIRSRVSVVLTRLISVIFFAAATSTVVSAQVPVEIEVAGPWSYVEDPADSNRVIIVAPQGHTMAIFTGEDVSQYTGKPAVTLGLHRLDFDTAKCGSGELSSFYLYPVNRVSSTDVQKVVSSTSAFSVSLPKPCSYESQVESVFKYHGRKDVTTTDPERSFTTSMTLHYVVPATTTGGVLDGATGKPIPFDTNNGTTKKAISVVLHQDTDPETECDSESATAFDATLKLWGVARPHRIFPRILWTPGTDYNQQIPGSYAPTCHQTLEASKTEMPHSKDSKQKRPKINPVSAKQWPRAPGRADCHAAQVNVNGVVN